MWLQYVKRAVVEVSSSMAGPCQALHLVAVRLSVLIGARPCPPDYCLARAHLLKTSSLLSAVNRRPNTLMAKISPYHTNSMEYLPKHREVYHDA